MERYDRIKIFEKKNDTYKETGVKWFKRNRYPHFIKNGVYFKKKWFLSGKCNLNYDRVISKRAYLVIKDERGETLATLLKKKIKHEEDKKTNYIEYFIVFNRQPKSTVNFLPRRHKGTKKK